MLRGFRTLYWGLLGSALCTQGVLCRVCLFKRPQQLVDSVVLNAGAPGEPRQRRGESSKEKNTFPGSLRSSGTHWHCHKGAFLKAGQRKVNRQARNSSLCVVVLLSSPPPHPHPAFLPFSKGMASSLGTDKPRLLQVFRNMGMLKVTPRLTGCICGPCVEGEVNFTESF